MVASFIAARWALANHCTKLVSTSAEERHRPAPRRRRYRASFVCAFDPDRVLALARCRMLAARWTPRCASKRTFSGPTSKRSTKRSAAASGGAGRSERDEEDLQDAFEEGRRLAATRIQAMQRGKMARRATSGSDVRPDSGGGLAPIESESVNGLFGDGDGFAFHDDNGTPPAEVVDDMEPLVDEMAVSCLFLLLLSP